MTVKLYSDCEATDYRCYSQQSAADACMNFSCHHGILRLRISGKSLIGSRFPYSSVVDILWLEYNATMNGIPKQLFLSKEINRALPNNIRKLVMRTSQYF